MGMALSLALQLQASALPASEPEYEFALAIGRKWRFDHAWPEWKVAAEREGGVWTGGRHTRPKGFLGDLDKYNHCAVMGWMLVRYTPQMEADGRALALVAEALRARGWRP